MRLEDFIYDPSLVLYVPFYKKDGTVFMSDDAYGHPCTVTGATWGLQGRTFNGTTDKITLSSTLPFDVGAGSYTVFVWFNYATTANDKPLFNSQVAAGHRRINLRSSAFSRQGPTSGIQEAIFTALPANNWNSLTGVYDRESHSIIVYSQGRYLTQTTSITDESLNASNLNEIGFWTVLDFKFAGGIGEIWFFNKSLAAINVQNLYLLTKWRYQ